MSTQSYSLEFFILSSTIFSTAIFLLFFSHTAFEWTTSGEIPIILRDLDPSFLLNDFYTNASSASPKLIFAKFVNFFQIFGLDWYSALYLLKSISVILSPPLLFLAYVKISNKWMPNNLEASFANIIFISIFIGTLGLFGIPQFLDRMAPFGWGAIQFFYAVDSMRISFLVGLIYLILKFSKTSRTFLQISLLCISTLMHPTIGIINFIFSLIFSLPLGTNRKNFLILFLESIMGIVLPIALLSAYFDSESILSARDFYNHYVETRLPQHYKISSIIDIFSFVWVVLLILPILISNYLKNKNLKILSWLIFLSF
ncbi:hypothetical protein N9N89_04290, partial [Gammaproteobacteria bacterium]|nr:hypothetical protein [Gammaproteobacteria bacterium]